MDWFRSNRFRATIVGVVLFAGTVLLFSRAIPYGFTNYDDTVYITDNHQVQKGLTAESIWWAFTGKTDYWHPLTWLSHMLDWELYGLDASGHRTTSILWHAANAVLLFLVLRRMTGAFWTSALCAAFFAWHPLRVESVIWMPERKDVMSGFFFLLLLWAYTVYADKRRLGQDRPARIWFGLALAAFAGGLMCKPILVAAPVVLLLLDVWPLNRISLTREFDFKPAGKLLLEKAPFVAGSAVITVVTIVMQANIGAFTLEVSFLDRVANALVSIPRYLGKIVFPVDLAVIYPHPGSWPLIVVAASTAVVASLTGLAWLQRAAQPWLLAGWGWFLAMLLPTLGILQVGMQSMADRYTYLPAIGIVFGACWALRTIAAERKQAGVYTFLGILALAALILRAWDQQRYWTDPPTLFAHASVVTENNYPAHAYYALSVFVAGDPDEAERHANYALELKPDFPAAIQVLALVDRQRGKLDEAAAGFRRVIELSPRPAGTYRDLGDVLLQQNKLDEATAAYEAALNLNPEMTQVRVNLARIDMARGDTDSAIARLRRALEINSGEAAGWLLLGDTLAQARKFAEAAESYEEALRLDPDNAETHARLGFVFVVLKRPADALSHWETALRINPQFPGLKERLDDLRGTPSSTP